MRARRFLALGLVASSLAAVPGQSSTAALGDQPPVLAAALTAPGEDLIRIAAGAFDPLVTTPSLAGVPTIAEGDLGSAPVAWLFQLGAGSDPAVLDDAIAAAGASVESAVPDRTLVVIATPSQRATIAAAATDVVRWSGLLQPAWKLWRSLDGSQGLLDRHDESTPLRAYFYSTHPRAESAAASLDEVDGVQVLKQGSRVVEFRATREALVTVANLPSVAWVAEAPAYELHNARARWVGDTGIRQVYGATAPGRLDGAGQVASAADTGLNYTDTVVPAHISFSDCRGGACLDADFTQVVPGSSADQIEDVRDNRAADGLAPHRKMVAYFDMSAAGPAPYDESAHGSHVAGSVTGDLLGNGTWDGNDGMAPAARYIHEGVSGYDGGLGGLPADIYDLYKAPYRPDDPGSVVEGGDDAQRIADRFAYRPLLDARTHNYSIGLIVPIVDLGDAFRADRFIWDHEDWTPVTSAGNSGPGIATGGSPGVAKSILVSGASANGDQPMVSIGSNAIFSSHGPTADGRYFVLGMTPGQVVVSTKGGSAEDFHYLQGTSMSAPVMTGLTTLVREYFCDGYGPDDGVGMALGEAIVEPGDCVHNPSNALVRATLANGAVRQRGFYTGDDGEDRTLDGQYPSTGQGFGRITLDNSLYFAGDDHHAVYHDVWRDDDDAFAVGPAATRTFDIEVASSDQPLNVTMAYTDAPTDLAAGVPSTVNGLYLTVTGPDGTYYGNVFNTRTDPAADEWETPPDQAVVDTVNQIQRIRVATPTPGTYTVTINAPATVMGPQGFAWSATGDLADTAEAPPLGDPLQSDVAGNPLITDVTVNPVSANTILVDVTTSEPTTAAIDVNDVTYVSEMDAGADGFHGLETGTVETAPDTGGVPWLTGNHRIYVTGLSPGESFTGTLRVTDLGDNEVTQTVAIEAPAVAFQADAADIGQLFADEELPTDIITGSPGWGTATQLYVGSLGAGAEALGAFMLRIPEAVDPSTIRGAYIEASSAHNYVILTEEQTVGTDPPPDAFFQADLLAEDVEADWGSQGYSAIASAESDARLAPMNANYVGGGRAHRWSFTCQDLQALVDTLETVVDGQRQAAFRLTSSNTSEDVATQALAFETGVNRRSLGPQLRPRLVLITDDGVDHFPRIDEAVPVASTQGPNIRDVRVIDVGDEDVTVSWRTDVPADSQVVVVDFSGTVVSEVADPAHRTLHAVTVKGVQDQGLGFAVRSQTTTGGSAVDANDGQGYAFDLDAGTPAVPPTEFVDLQAWDFNDGLQGWTITDESTGDAPSGWSHNPIGGPAADGAVTLQPYTDETRSILTAPEPVTFGDTFPRLSFSAYVDTELDFDYLYVETSTNGGANWVQQQAYSGNNPTWVDEDVDLAGIDPADEVLLRFVFQSDALVTQGTGVGVDNVVLRAGTDGQAAVPGPGEPTYGPDLATPFGLSGLTVPSTRTGAPDDADLAAGTSACVEVAAAAPEPAPAPEPEQPLPTTGGGAAIAVFGLLGLAAIASRRRAMV